MTTDTEINSIKTGVSGSSPVLDCDFHTHTGFSDDCDVSADVMLESCADQGIIYIAVSYDYVQGYHDPELPTTSLTSTVLQCSKTSMCTSMNV